MYSIDKELEEQSHKKVEVEIHPVSKWKRILLYLGNMMLTFICAFVIFNCVVYPIANAVAPVNNEDSQIAAKHRDDVLYGHKLLFYKDEESPKHNIPSNLKYTFDRFISYYVFDEGVIVDETHPEYAHIEENEVIRTYYKNIRNDSTTYISLFKVDTDIFVVDGDNISLTENAKMSIGFYFDPHEKTETDVYTKASEAFASMFGAVTKDILKNDLVYEVGGGISYSYKNSQAIIDNNQNTFDTRMTISVLIAHVLAVAIIHFIYPLINRNGRTPLMSIMKMDRLGINTLRPVSKVETALIGGYGLAFDLPYIFLIPLSYIDFLHVFDYTLLITFSLMGLLLIIIGLVVTLVTTFNQSLTDLVTRTIIAPTEDLDAVERAKNYGK